MDKETVRRDFLKRNNARINEELAKRSENAKKKIIMHKYGINSREGDTRDDR